MATPTYTTPQTATGAMPPVAVSPRAHEQLQEVAIFVLVVCLIAAIALAMTGHAVPILITSTGFATGGLAFGLPIVPAQEATTEKDIS